jgi:DNA-directed RNA polymerase subunit RPC12/RpoP
MNIQEIHISFKCSHCSQLTGIFSAVNAIGYGKNPKGKIPDIGIRCAKCGSMMRANHNGIGLLLLSSVFYFAAMYPVGAALNRINFHPSPIWLFIVLYLFAQLWLSVFWIFLVNFSTFTRDGSDVK